jgi:hypothetical protein
MIGKTLTAALVAAVVAVPAAAQQQYKTSGFQLGAALAGTGIQVEDADEAESGAGLSLRLGYGFTDRVSVFAQGTGASMEDGDYDLGHFDLGVRYLFSTARLRPYVEGGVGARAVQMEIGGTDVEVAGGALTLGGGLEYSFGRTAGLDVGLDYTFGEFNQGRLDGGDWEDLESESFSATSARFNVGIVWRP